MIAEQDMTYTHSDQTLRSVFPHVAWIIGLAAVFGCGGRHIGNPGGGDGGPECGNNVLEAGEQCDGNELGGLTCRDLGFEGGTLGCTSECTFNRRGCIGGCGNEAVEPPEECDGQDMAGQTCTTLTGHTHGELSCGVDCAFDTSDCHTCGDGLVETIEQCDDANLSDGDGCSSTCQTEEHWQCIGEPSQCECVEFYQGENCDLCIVFVNHDTTINQRDGKSWSTAFATVQEGIDQAFSVGGNCEVWVARGTYYVYETSPSDTVLLASRVAVYGGFVGSETARGQRDWQANHTILSGAQEGSPPNHVYHVVKAQNVDEAVIDGFVITEGEALGANANGRGGGLYNDNSSLTISNCTFANNAAGGKGGGMYNLQSSPVVTDCLFEGNFAENGGGMYNTSSSAPTVTRCTFLGNWTINGSGSGMYNDGSSPTVMDCVFSDMSEGMYNGSNASPTVTGCVFDGNSEGMLNSESSPTVTYSTFAGNSDTGMSNHYHSSPTVRDCTFVDNGDSGMTNYESSPTVENCIFEANSATSGAGMNNRNDSSPMVINCVFTGNVADSSGGGMSNSDFSSPTVTNCTFYNNVGGVSGVGGAFFNNQFSSPLVTNCIIWGNEPNAFYNSGGSSPYVTYCDIEGGYSGTGNIDATPMFVDPNNGDFHLQPGSPCIDSGDGDLAPATDMEGNSRCDDPNTPDNGMGTPPYTDMGAYEYQASGCP